MIRLKFFLMFCFFWIIHTEHMGWSQERHILILPSGGATGIIPLTVLTHLEQTLKVPIYVLFDEIWSSSVGSIIGSLLTLPQQSLNLQQWPTTQQPNGRPLHPLAIPHPINASTDGPLSARNVSLWVKNVFSTYSNAWKVKRFFKKLVQKEILFQQTLIPLRVLAAEVIDWKGGFYPAKTQLKKFSTDQDGSLSLSEVVSGSCSVFPLHPRVECIHALQKNCSWSIDSYCLDAGSDVCTESCMNPLWTFLDSYLQFRTAQEEAAAGSSNDSLVLYFMSTGWVRLPENQDYYQQRFFSHHPGKEVKVEIYNLDIDLSALIQEWQESSWIGTGIKHFCNRENLIYNLLGAGTLSMDQLITETQNKINASLVLPHIQSRLQQHLQTKEFRSVHLF